jgi:polyphosphate kinase 2 (PPK2 family)
MMKDRKKVRGTENPPMRRKEYEKELERHQVELCKLQEWVKHKGLRIIVVFEGRDGAGKGAPSRQVRSASISLRPARS